MDGRISTVRQMPADRISAGAAADSSTRETTNPPLFRRASTRPETHASAGQGESHTNYTCDDNTCKSPQPDELEPEIPAHECTVWYRAHRAPSRAKAPGGPARPRGFDSSPRPAASIGQGCSSVTPRQRASPRPYPGARHRASVSVSALHKPHFQQQLGRARKGHRCGEHPECIGNQEPRQEYANPDVDRLCGHLTSSSRRRPCRGRKQRPLRFSHGVADTITVLPQSFYRRHAVVCTVFRRLVPLPQLTTAKPILEITNVPPNLFFDFSGYRLVGCVHEASESITCRHEQWPQDFPYAHRHVLFDASQPC